MKIIALTFALTLGFAMQSAMSADASRTYVSPATMSSVNLAFLSDSEVTQQARSYLSTIDTPIPSDAWRALGSRAVPVLQSTFADRNVLPTRRAMALDALAAIGQPSMSDQLMATALDIEQPLVVRLAAVRGLPVALPSGNWSELAQALMATANDSRVRAIAALVLVRGRSAGGCTSVRAHVASESAEVVHQFDRALASCSPSR